MLQGGDQILHGLEELVVAPGCTAKLSPAAGVPLI
jgi:hypothetical protein